MANSKIPNWVNTKVSKEIAVLRSGDDLDNYKGTNATGLYEITTGVANAPIEWCWMLVIGGSGSIQIIFSQTRIYVRAYTGNPLHWQAWCQVGLTLA